MLRALDLKTVWAYYLRRKYFVSSGHVNSYPTVTELHVFVHKQSCFTVRMFLTCVDMVAVVGTFQRGNTLV